MQRTSTLRDSYRESQEALFLRIIIMSEVDFLFLYEKIGLRPDGREQNPELKYWIHSTARE
jgi:hypothetical protein